MNTSVGQRLSMPAPQGQKCLHPGPSPDLVLHLPICILCNVAYNQLVNVAAVVFLNSLSCSSNHQT